PTVVPGARVLPLTARQPVLAGGAGLCPGRERAAADGGPWRPPPTGPADVRDGPACAGGPGPRVAPAAGRGRGPAAAGATGEVAGGLARRRGDGARRWRGAGHVGGVARA